MEAREHPRIVPDLEVFDADAQKAGTVGRVYERTPGAADSAATSVISIGTSPVAADGKGVMGDGAFELKTGLFGLGTHYYVPFGAVKEVTNGGVFLTRRKGEFSDLDWTKKPDFIANPEDLAQPVTPADAGEAVGPNAREVTAPTMPPATAPTTSAPESWDAVRSHYRSRWVEHYGVQEALWETYEPRYRFAWEMAQRPEFQGQSWVSVQPELRSRWEERHPDLEWDVASDTIRDAWEHPATAVR